MYESMIFGAKNFLRLILKFSKIGLKKLSENLKNQKIGKILIDGATDETWTRTPCGTTPSR